jgi:hypothetical protein
MRRSSLSATRHPDDDGSILPMVLVVTIVLAVVVVATAAYATSALRYGQVVERRTDRLSAAEGGMRDLIDRINDGQLPLCGTAAGVGGISLTLPPLNEAAVNASCQQVDGALSDLSAWAMVITGVGVPPGDGLQTQGGDDPKTFGGLTYVNNLNLMNLQKDLKIEQGDLWSTVATCSEGGEYASATHPNVIFDDSLRGVWCTNRPWEKSASQPNGLFSTPTLPTLPTGTAPPAQLINGCTVFYPGRYTSPPAFGAFNYMSSGDYLFDFGTTVNNGEITIDGDSVVTAGRAGATGESQVIQNSVCDPIRNGDTPTGATFFMDKTTHFAVKKGSLEVTRRKQGDDYVSIQTLASHSLNYQTPVVTTDSGNNKEMAIRGLVWAPRARIVFGNVTNTVVAQISGGAVVAAAEVQSSGSASGLLISVTGSPASDRWALTSTATTPDGGITRVRVVAQVRFSASATTQGVWETAINSWRVCDNATC